MGRPRKTAAADNGNSVSAVRKEPKTMFVASATTSREKELRYP